MQEDCHNNHKQKGGPGWGVLRCHRASDPGDVVVKRQKKYLLRSLRKKAGGDGDERRAGNGTWEKLTDNAGSHS